MPIFSTALPKYGGPYAVGTVDIELPVSRPRSFGTTLLGKTREPALYLETVLATLFYPADSHSKGTGQHMPWLERPLSETAAGYAALSGKSTLLLRSLLWITASGTRVPAYTDATLATSSDDKPFPLIFFSHGLSGNRTTYTQYCGELASRGYIVAAIEHRDGTAPTTRITAADGTSRTTRYYQTKDLAWEAPNKKLSSLDFRKEELDMRLAEIEGFLDVVKRVNKGEGAQVAAENRRKQGVTLSGWTDRLDLSSNLIMAGHSFGGATTFKVLRSGSFEFVKGIALDPWVDPIAAPEAASADGSLERQASSSRNSARAAAESAETLKQEISVPLLVFNSEAFTFWREHFVHVKDIVVGVGEASDAWLLTMAGSIHLSFSDFPLILPFLARKVGHARVNARVAMADFVEASFEFLSAAGGRKGRILGHAAGPEDADGARPGEGSKEDGGKPMEPVGELRIHYSPLTAKARL